MKSQWSKYNCLSFVFSFLGFRSSYVCLVCLVFVPFFIFENRIMCRSHEAPVYHLGYIIIFILTIYQVRHTYLL